MATTKKKTTSPSYLGDYASGSYTPSYDYVSGYYNQNAGYQNPSVYGYRGNRYNIPTNAGFAIPMKDNDQYWNLGAMLGGLWGANYNQRGARAAGETAQKMLNDYNSSISGAPQESQDGALYKQFQKANGEVPAAEVMDYSKAPTGMYKQFEATGGNVISPSEQEQARRQEAKNNLYDSYAKKFYPNGPDGPVNKNPTENENEGNNISKAVGGDISKIDVTKLGNMGFDADLLRANIIAKLKKDNRNDWQIAQAMQGIEPMLLSKQREYNDKLYETLYPQYEALLKNGRAEDAGILLSKMNKLKPENAEALNIGYKKELGYAIEDETIDRRINQYMKRFPNATKEEATMYAMNLTGGRNASKGLLSGSVNRSTGTPSTSTDGYVTASDGTPFIKVTDKMAETYQKRLNDLYKKENKTQHDKDLIVWLNQAIDSTYSGNPYVRPFGYTASTKNGDASGDPQNNYDAAMSLATKKFEETVKKTGSADKALAAVKDVFGSGGMGEQIYNDVKNGELYKAWKGAGSPGDSGGEKTKPDYAGYRKYLMDNGIAINNLGEISSSNYNSSPEETQRIDEIVELAKQRFNIN